MHVHVRPVIVPWQEEDEEQQDGLLDLEVTGGTCIRWKAPACCAANKRSNKLVFTREGSSVVICYIM